MPNCSAAGSPAPAPTGCLATPTAWRGRPEEAHGVLNFLLERSTEQFIWPEIIAFVYAGLGEKDRAFEWLEKGFEGRGFWLTTLQVNPLFDPLRSDPRFQDLLRRMNFPE